MGLLDVVIYVMTVVCILGGIAYTAARIYFVVTFGFTLNNAFNFLFILSSVYVVLYILFIIEYGCKLSQKTDVEKQRSEHRLLRSWIYPAFLQLLVLITVLRVVIFVVSCGCNSYNPLAAASTALLCVEDVSFIIAFSSVCDWTYAPGTSRPAVLWVFVVSAGWRQIQQAALFSVFLFVNLVNRGANNATNSNVIEIVFYVANIYIRLEVFSLIVSKLVRHRNHVLHASLKQGIV